MDHEAHRSGCDDQVVVAVHEDAPFKEIVELMERHRVSALPVVDANEHVIGVVSEADLLLKEELGSGHLSHLLEMPGDRHDRKKAEARTAGQLMSHPAAVIGADVSLPEAAKRLHEHGVRRLIVTDGGRLCGILSRRDILRIFVRSDEEIEDEIVHGILEGTMWLPPGAVRVRVRRGVVTLEGRLERRAILPLLLELVRGVEGVVGIEDHLSYEVDDGRPPIATPFPWVSTV